ncbi:UDP-glucose 6-dehydrogenase [Candidatus Marinamargulisbacteria bacterium SCGC AG-343-D04]|nr:UDP-glucose 6-dehydrogenase [Candidatus Marinamargulisbacteria bacterium SCGC AG-343-D04]
MKICVVGTGYVGLVTGTCLADLGNEVICIDNNQKKLDILNKNEVPFYEPGLKERINRNRDSGRLIFSNDLKSALQFSSVVFIAVGTPPLESGKADLSSVFSVSELVFKFYKELGCSDFKVLVTKSTVPVGTGKKIEALRNDFGFSSDQIAMASNPEFLREGNAIYDFFHPDRIVIGSSSEKALDRLTEVYDPLYRTETPIVRTDLCSSELSKYASNAFLATKISFINEMANLCELSGADVHDISKIMGMDGRIGRYFLHPGPGYGGSCFPKDTQALVHTADEFGYDLKIVKSVEEVNEQQKVRVMSYVDQYFGSDLSGKCFAVLGISFKPNTDDVRDASSLVLIRELLKRGALVKAFDPEVRTLSEFSKDESFSFSKNSYDAVKDADALFLVTEWNTFRELDLEHIKSLMNAPVFFDLRNVYSPEKLKKMGFKSYVIGRTLLSN